MDIDGAEETEDVERRIQSHLCDIRIVLGRSNFTLSGKKMVELKLREIVESEAVVRIMETARIERT